MEKAILSATILAIPSNDNIKYSLVRMALQFLPWKQFVDSVTKTAAIAVNPDST